MRKSRLKAPPHHPLAYYHCVSRVVNREFVFGPEEKEEFVRLMRLYSPEAFAEVRWQLENLRRLGAHKEAEALCEKAFSPACGT